MFLATQQFSKPWDESNDKTMKKTFHYYKTSSSENLWTNQTRTCEKVHKLMNFPSEKYNRRLDKGFYGSNVRNQKMKQEQLFKDTVIDKKMESLDRINSRKIERLLLQHKCKQYLGTTADLNLLNEISQKDKALYEELSLKRSTTFKDPSKTLIDKRNSWEAYNQLPTKELRKLILPNIVRMDQKAVSLINDKIKGEEYINEIQRLWIQEQRQELRDKLKQRHNKQIELLKKSGLKNPFRQTNRQKYNSIDDRAIFGNNIMIRDDNTTEIERFLDEHHDSIISHNLTKPDEEKIISQRDNLDSRFKLVQENQRYNSPCDRVESCLTPIKKKNIDSDNEENVRDLENITAMNDKTVSDKLFNNKASKTDRTRFIEDTYNRLYDTKKVKDVSNPYLATDYRGLLISDYNEALNNCDTGDYKPLISLDKELLGGSRLRIGKRKSNATKELFPTPYDLTKFNIENIKKRMTVRIGGATNTASKFYNPAAM